jgi:Mn-dependent DtxR family transcriptional regulator
MGNLNRVVIKMKSQEKYHTVRGYQLLRKGKKQLTPSMEDYLEMIYRNYKKDGYARVNTLAKKLNVKASSVTKMVQKLTELELLIYEKYGIISLTPKGMKLGRFLLNRHRIVENFLKLLGVEDNLLKETELIEHNVSITTLKKIDYLNRFFDENIDIKERFLSFTQTVFDIEDEGEF